MKSCAIDTFEESVALKGGAMAGIDERVTKTKEAIRKAFFEVAKEAGYKKASVSAIIKRAQINRNTFYNHYESKDDLVYKLELEMFNHMKSISENNPLIHFNDDQEIDFDKFFLDIATFIYAEGDKVALLLSNNGDPLFIIRLKEVIYEMWERTEMLERLSIPQNYALAIQTGIITNLISEWALNDFKETPEEFAKILKQIMLTFNFNYIEVGKL